MKKMVTHQNTHQYFHSVTVPKGQGQTNIYNTKTELQFESEIDDEINTVLRFLKRVDST